MIEEVVHFCSSGGLKLEGVLAYREDVHQCPKVLLCPPHPNLGGDMDNNVILALARTLAEREFITLRFNYRGVGRSQSPYKGFAENYSYWETTYGDGNLEGPQDDTRAAVRFLKSVTAENSSRMFVVGYSFGAVMGMKVGVTEGSVKALVGIATPFGGYSFDFLAGSKIPKLFIVSNDDFATTIEATRIAIRRLSEPKELIVKTKTGHFYIGTEQELCEDILRFFQRIGYRPS